jgi:hypothetical protein
MADIGNALIQGDFRNNLIQREGRRKPLTQKRSRKRSRSLKQPKFEIADAEESRIMEGFLVRVVLEVLAFTYSVDPFALEAALGEQSTIMHSIPHDHGRQSLLSRNEKLEAYRLGEAMTKACAKFGEEYLDHDECHKLFSYVLLPAQNLDIYPEYIFEKLMEFRSHRCLPGHEKETLLWAKATSIAVFGCELVSKRWMTEKQQMYLANCLTSDEIVLGKIALPLEAKTLINEAISRFGKKHCKSGMRKLSRADQAEPGTVSMALVEELWAWYGGLKALEQQKPIPVPGRAPALPRVEEEKEPSESRGRGQEVANGLERVHECLPRSHSTLGAPFEREDKKSLKRQISLDSYNLLEACAQKVSRSQMRPRSQSAVGQRFDGQTKSGTRPLYDSGTWQ